VVFRINAALQGPVVDILGQFLPELNALPREQAYDHTLDDLGLLTRCFQVFRRERHRFRHVLVDDRRRPVTDDGTVLSCGRTLAEVIAMVVRTAAKRYFRRVRTPIPGMSTHAAADQLYDAIKAFLLHEWQVPLVPTYAGMEPALVRRVGARLLDARDAAALARLINDPDGRAPMGTTPRFDAVAPIDDAHDQAVGGGVPGGPHPLTADLADILTGDQTRLRAEAFTQTLLDPDVRAVLPNADQILKIGGTLRAVGAQPAAALVEHLGLRKDQLAVMLLVAHDCIGATVFGRLFGTRADPELVTRIIERARLHGLGPEAGVIDCAIFMRTLFARFGHRSRRD
jgi:hypothetical protein